MSGDYLRFVIQQPVRIEFFAEPLEVNTLPGAAPARQIPVNQLPQDVVDDLALRWITQLYNNAGLTPPDLKWHNRGVVQQ